MFTFRVRLTAVLVAVLATAGCANEAAVVVQPTEASGPSEQTTPASTVETEPTPTPASVLAAPLPLATQPPVERSVDESEMVDERASAETAPTPTTEADEADDVVAPECRRIASFASGGEQGLWVTVNDGVMGGRSSGGPTFAESVMRFAGELNTNGGGFSSVRVGLFPGALTGFSQMVVRARTDGRTYKLIFDDALEGRDRRISHQAELRFEQSDDWQIGVVQFENLTPSLFGRSVQTAAFRPDLATEIGLQISDGIDGSFEIEIDWIEACQ